MRKHLLAAAISTVGCAPAAAVEFQVSGHVNRMLRFAGDGQGSAVQHLDNTTSRSRFRFTGSADVGRGMQAGVRYEMGMASNRSGNVPLKSADTGDSFSGTGNDIRHSALWFRGTWGRLWLGHTSMASEDAADADLSGTDLANRAMSGEHCAACFWRTTAGAFGPTIGVTTPTQDGVREDTLRYDAPALGPLTVSVAVGNDEDWDVGLFLDTDLAGGRLDLRAGYFDTENRRGFEQWQVSGSYRFSQGTNVTVVYYERDRAGGGEAGRRHDDLYVKLGQWWGDHAVSASYRRVEDAAASGSDVEAWGVAYTYHLPKPAIEIYAGYWNHALDVSPTGLANLNANGGFAFAPGTEFDDIDMFLIGSRIRFR